MPKITLFILSLMLTGIILRGQTVQQTSFNVDSLFQQLDTSLISTGILIDKVPTETNLDLYKGSCNDCVMEPETFEQMLLNFKQASFQENKFLDSTYERYQEHLSNNREVPIQVANILYNKIKDYAVDSNLLEDNNGILDEGNNTSESPYETKRFVGLAVPVKLRPQGLSFSLDSSFYLSNEGSTPSQIQIDFGDGQGYQNIAFGQTLTPQYGELSNPKFEIGLKLTINEQTYISKSKMTLVLCGSANVPTPVAPPWSNASQFQFGNLVSYETYNPNGHAAGNVYVHYRPNPAPGTENQFKKPLIVVEGIDFEPYNQQNAANYQMGDFGWCALWGQNMDDYPQLAKMPQLLNDYHSDGYDIIMLDFKDGATDIKENAYLLQTLIKRVNQYKTTDAEANVVIGASMGAIVSRYALADMEADGNDHCTRLYVSFDGPHQGANIPLGAQYAIKFFATNSVQQFAQARQFLYGSLSRKAARQLLSLQLYNSWENDHNNFFTELNNLGYPQKCKNVAIASGSGHGNNQGYPGGTQIVQYDYTGSSFFGLYADLHIWALPGRSSDNQIFHGQIPYFNGLFSGWGSTQMWVTVPSSLPHYDNSPGGVREVAEEMAEIDTDGKGQINALESEQSFVPTISALDINTTNLFYDVHNNIPDGDNPNSNLTPFDAIYFPTDNTLHVEATDGTPPSRGDNIAFAKAKVNLGQGVGTPILTSTYNYGEELNDLVTHSQVINSGELHLYGNFNDSKTGQTPPSGNTHVYRLGNGCVSSDLVIDQNGELIIGDASVNNKAELRITDGASLTIANNGKLTVEDGSKLIIEDGGNLIFENSAQIDLAGYGSRLTIKGKLTVGDNANFTFFGDGYLIFDQNMPWLQNATGSYQPLDDYWDIGQNATFTLEGPSGSNVNTNHKLVEVKRPTSLRMEDGTTFDRVNLQYGKIEIGPGVNFFTFSPTYIFHTKIVCSDPSQKHGGLRIWNTSGQPDIFDLEVKQGNPGLLLHAEGAIGEMRVRNSDFSDNIAAIKVLGGSFGVLGSNFSNNRVAVETSEISGNCLFSGNTIMGVNSGDKGLFSLGQEGSHIEVKESDFDNLLDGAYLYGIDGRLECNTFTANSNVAVTGIESTLDLGAGASNNFIGNGTDISLLGEPENVALYLDEGQNDFEARGRNDGDYIDGYVFGYPQFLDNNGQLPVHQNHIPPYYMLNGNLKMPVDIRYAGNSQPVPLVSNDFSASLTQDCNNSGGGAGAGHCATVRILMQSQEPGGRILAPGSTFHDEPLRDAAIEVIDSISLGEEIRDDYWALQGILDILEAQHTEIGPGYHRINALLYRKLHSALSNSYQYAGLVNEQEAGVGYLINEVDRSVVVVDSMLAKLDATDTLDQPAVFRLSLDKVHLYRVSGYYNQANSILNTSSQWTFNYDQQMRAGYWSCICQLEQDYFNDQIEPETYLAEKEACKQQYAGYTKKQSATQSDGGYRIDQDISSVEMYLYPQPASDKLIISFDSYVEKPLKVKLYDILGQEVLAVVLQNESGKYTLDCSSLPKGAYILKVAAEGVVKSESIILE